MEIFLGLLPIIATIFIVLIFKKVILGLSSGLILSMVIITIQNKNWDAFLIFWNTIEGIFSSWDGKIAVIAFLYFASLSSAIVISQGGASSFANKFVSKVKTKKRTLLVIATLGLLIFIDGLLNSLVVGSTTKHISDKHKVSRAKLSYIVDSTSSPMASLVVFSSWGSYIVTILSGIEGVQNPTREVIMAAFSQYYEIFAIILVFIVIIFKMDFGPMKTYEHEAENGKDTSSIEFKSEVKPSSYLIALLPLISFIFSTLISWIIISLVNDTKLIDTYFNLPLAIGTLIMLLTAFITSYLNEHFDYDALVKATKKSFVTTSKNMILVICLAWSLTDQIFALDLGTNIADLITNSSIDVMWIPLVLFILASIISFSLGTSWGTFILLIPIFVPIAVQHSQLEISVVLAAILGGAVFGDHTSPVSDTTIVSASASGCSLEAHFKSQLPYAFIAGACTLVGYSTYALAGNVWLPLLISFTMFILITSFIKLKTKSNLTT